MQAAIITAIIATVIGIVEDHREKTRIDLRWCYHLRQAREAEEDQRKWQEGYEQRSGHTSGPQ